MPFGVNVRENTNLIIGPRILFGFLLNPPLIRGDGWIVNVDDFRY